MTDQDKAATDWTGATWVLPEGVDAGQRVTITKLCVHVPWGEVWEGDLSGGGTIIFCVDTLDREINPKTRKPYSRGACA